MAVSLYLTCYGSIDLTSVSFYVVWFIYCMYMYVLCLIILFFPCSIMSPLMQEYDSVIHQFQKDSDVYKVRCGSPIKSCFSAMSNFYIQEMPLPPIETKWVHYAYRDIIFYYADFFITLGL